VNLHVFLEIKVSKVFTLGNIEKLVEMLIRNNNTLIILFLEFMLLAICSNTLGNFSPSNEVFFSKFEKSTEIIRYWTRFRKTI